MAEIFFSDFFFFWKHTLSFHKNLGFNFRLLYEKLMNVDNKNLSGWTIYVETNFFFFFFFLIFFFFFFFFKTKSVLFWRRLLYVETIYAWFWNRIGTCGPTRLTENCSLKRFFKHKNWKLYFSMNLLNHGKTAQFSEPDTGFPVSSSENFFVKSSFRLAGYVL